MTPLAERLEQLLEQQKGWNHVIVARADVGAAITESVDAALLRGLLTEFVVDVHDDDCRIDHHGDCQAHFVQPAGECVVLRARQLLGLDVKQEAPTTD